MEDFSGWIGREEEQSDTACAHRAAGLHALFDGEGPPPPVLPPLGHWLLAQPTARQSELDLDGHPRRGGKGLLPPIPLPRRMWAGSDVEFLSPVAVGAPVVRRSRIAAIASKTGRSGAMVFVTVHHELLCHGQTAIREHQHIVYREPQNSSAAVTSEPTERGANVRTVTADPVMLFRYSALTFNGHRIHYDRDHARFEGYPGLVVHGPLLATLLLNHYRAIRAEADVAAFAFRARAPVFDGATFTLNASGERLWIAGADGLLAMTAQVTPR